MSLFGKITGTDQVAAAAKSGKKAAKKQEATANQQLQYGKDIYGQGTAAAAGAVPQQVNALNEGLAGSEASLDPYAQQGADAGNALAGFYGNDPASSAATYNDFVNSPYYKATVAPAQAAAQQEVERRFAGTGQAGAVGQALQDRLAEVGGRGFMDWTGFGERALGRGQDAAGQIAGYRSGTGAAKAGAYGSYADRILGAGGNATGAAGSAYGNILAAQGARGEAAAAGHMGQANTISNIWGGLAGIAGKAAGAWAGRPPVPAAR